MMGQSELVTILINTHMHMDSLQMERISELDMQKCVLMVPIEQFVIKISQQLRLVYCVREVHLTTWAIQVLYMVMNQTLDMLKVVMDYIIYHVQVLIGINKTVHIL